MYFGVNWLAMLCVLSDPLDLLRFEDSVKEEGEEEYVHN